MMFKKTILLFVFLIAFKSIAQNPIEESPKLVVGIVVDQMRVDYLDRFWDKFSEEGFKKMVNDGFNFKNNHFNYLPTYTGPGHASVWTGTSPMNHGIIGNNWYDKFKDEVVYCAEDGSVTPIGTTSDAGMMSPHRMKTTTVADQNRLQTQMKGKTIGVALKDRGAILPAGHTANAAYWFHGKNEGKWISSSYYMEKLPEWVKEFNKSGKAESYLKIWNPLYDINTYTESGPDLTEFEGGFNGKGTATFPYDLMELRETNNGYDIIKSVPFGNDLTTDFALAAIEGEELGKDEHTDFLTLSYSSTDYVGHNFGINSKELQDTYLRLDRNIAHLLKELDEKIGAGNYLIFLTSDHGAVNVPNYLKSLKIPAGNFNTTELKKELLLFISETFGINNLIANVSNNQIFFNYDNLNELQIDSRYLQEKVSYFLLKKKNVSKVFTRSQLVGFNNLVGDAASVQNGFNQRRSGDVVYTLDPGFIPSMAITGTTHGSGFAYDTHAPLLFYGKGIKHGSTTRRSEIVDIAPTVSALLGISFPNGTTGRPLNWMFEDN